MNFGKIWRITQILLISQLRASATGRNVRSFIRRPRSIIILAMAAFVLTSVLSYLIGQSLLSLSPDFTNLIQSLVQGAIVTLPAIVLGVIFIFGLLLEISGGSQASASDTINWLPVSATDYVLGSMLTMFTYYSIIPAILLGLSLGIAYDLGSLGIWGLAAALSLCGVVIAASVLEILRAILNRFSTSFYKKGGRSAIAARAISMVLLILVAQLFFYPTFYERIIGSISATLGPYWFIPMLWSSVSVASLMGGQAVLAASFALLFLCFGGALTYVAILARTKYWVPVPASIRVSNAAYMPKGSSFLGFLSSPQLAIVRKDLRGLVRRRELTRFLAQPAVLFLIAFVGYSSSSGGFGSSLQYVGYFFIAISATILAIAEIGAEGKSISNLYQFPLSAKDFLIGKATTPIIFASAYAIAFFAIVAVISHFATLETIFVLLTGVAFVFEMTLLGMWIGIKFPNFSEQARTSFISMTAGVIATPIAFVLIGISIAPQIVVAFMGELFPYTLIAFGIGIALVAVFAFVFYELALGQTKKLLTQLPGQV